MSKSNTHENEYLKLIFQNIPIAGIGDANGLPASAGAGNLYIRLYTSATIVDDANVGTECAYGGYVAKGVAVARGTTYWTVTANSASNAAVIAFPTCTSGGETIRYFAIWKNNTSASESDRTHWGQLNADKTIAINDPAEFAVGALVVNED
jgi:hypothetical protein